MADPNKRRGVIWYRKKNGVHILPALEISAYTVPSFMDPYYISHVRFTVRFDFLVFGVVVWSNIWTVATE